MPRLHFEKFVRAYDQDLACSTDCEYIGVGLKLDAKHEATSDDSRDQYHKHKDCNHIPPGVRQNRNLGFIRLTDPSKQEREEADVCPMLRICQHQSELSVPGSHLKRNFIPLS